MTSTPFQAAGISGHLHAAAPARAGLVLTHGAGGDCDAPLLVAAAEAFARAGIAVLRCDLAFRQRRRTGPPSPATAHLDRAGLRQAVAALREAVGGPILLGGHSYGGRQASMLAAEDPAIAPGLVLFSYPLHPPGKPERLRTDHFPHLRVPSVFVHGETDPFGTMAELRSAVAAIPAATEIIEVPRAGHDLRRGRIDYGPITASVLSLLADRA